MCAAWPHAAQNAPVSADPQFRHAGRAFVASAESGGTARPALGSTALAMSAPVTASAAASVGSFTATEDSRAPASMIGGSPYAAYTESSHAERPKPEITDEPANPGAHSRRRGTSTGGLRDARRRSVYTGGVFQVSRRLAAPRDAVGRPGSPRQLADHALVRDAAAARHEVRRAPRAQRRGVASRSGRAPAPRRALQRRDQDEQDGHGPLGRDDDAHGSRAPHVADLVSRRRSTARADR